MRGNKAPCIPRDTLFHALIGSKVLFPTVSVGNVYNDSGVIVEDRCSLAIDLSIDR